MEKARIVRGRSGEVGGSLDLFKLKNCWSGPFQEGGMFSWPPRSYTCSFCRREFRSAQALGGHMNVHRRDRARLRLSPAKDDGELSVLHPKIETLNSNPSFLNSSAFKLNHMSEEGKGVVVEKHHVGELGDGLVKMKGAKGLFLLKKVDLWEDEKDCEGVDQNQELDLELRLGFSSYMK